MSRKSGVFGPGLGGWRVASRNTPVLSTRMQHLFRPAGRVTIGLASVVLAMTIGIAAGIGAYTFVYARGASYLTNDPTACMNCHVMREQFAGWTTSSHRQVAVCNDCHAPHGIVGKYVTKAVNGFWHSVAFTTGRFHEPIAIRPRNRAVTEGACRTCHQAVVQAIDPHSRADQATECIRCHRSVGHLH
jgi:cytochrome c nitrite reductase small subunit